MGGSLPVARGCRRYPIRRLVLHRVLPHEASSGLGPRPAVAMPAVLLFMLAISDGLGCLRECRDGEDRG